MVTRYNKVLCDLADVLEVRWRREGKYGKRPTDLKQGQKQLVKQGEATADTREPRRKSILDSGHGWKLKVDLDRKLIFPQHRRNQLKTSVLVSKKSKPLVAIELIVPWVGHLR